MTRQKDLTAVEDASAAKSGPLSQFTNRLARSRKETRTVIIDTTELREQVIASGLEILFGRDLVLLPLAARDGRLIDAAIRIMGRHAILRTRVGRFPKLHEDTKARLRFLELHGGVCSWEIQGRGHSSEFEPRPGLMLATSGSTAEPRLVVLDREVLRCAVERIISSSRLTATDVCLNVLPTNHTLGLLTGGLAPLWAGGSVVVADASALKSPPQQCTWAPMAPVHAALLSRQPTPDSWRMVRLSSAPVPVQLTKRLRSTGISVIRSYGMTEAPGYVASESVEIVSNFDSAGWVLPNDRCILRHQSNRNSTSAGLINVDGKNVATEVVLMQSGEIRRRRSGELLETTDLGQWNVDGSLRVLGRRDWSINRGGEIIHPEIIESAIPHDVVSCAVALPHPTLGNSICLILEGADKVDVGQLRRDLRRELGPSYVPARIVKVPLIPRLESSPSKIDRASALLLVSGLANEGMVTGDD